jgi:hypothetical protein
MHHTPIRPHSNRTATESFMTHSAMPILVDDNPPIQPPRSVRFLLVALPKQQTHLDPDLLHAPQPRHNTLLVQHRIRRAYAALEVALQIPDRQTGRHEVERCARGESGAVLGQQVESGGPVWSMRWWRSEVEGEEGVVDGWLSGVLRWLVGLGVRGRDGRGGGEKDGVAVPICVRTQTKVMDLRGMR